MPPSPWSSADVVQLAASPWEVRFFREGDCYRHEVAWVDGAGSCLLLQSLPPLPDVTQGAAAAAESGATVWPRNPPLQHLHVERRGAFQQVALLVGLAGQGHWSLAVSLVADGPHVRLTFDVACRASQPPANLGSRYRLPHAAAWDEPAGILRVGRVGVYLRPDRLAAASSVHLSQGELAIVPRAAGQIAPATWRWKWELSTNAEAHRG